MSSARTYNSIVLVKQVPDTKNITGEVMNCSIHSTISSGTRAWMRKPVKPSAVARCCATPSTGARIRWF